MAKCRLVGGGSTKKIKLLFFFFFLIGGILFQPSMFKAEEEYYPQYSIFGGIGAMSMGFIGLGGEYFIKNNKYSIFASSGIISGEESDDIFIGFVGGGCLYFKPNKNTFLLRVGAGTTGWTEGTTLGDEVIEAQEPIYGFVSDINYMWLFGYEKRISFMAGLGLGIGINDFFPLPNLHLLFGYRI